MHTVLLAQDARVSEDEAAQAAKSMRKVKENLKRREREVVRELEAMREEAEALKSFGGGQTLRGSRANEYERRIDALEERRARYRKAKERLEADHRLYDASLRKIHRGIAAGADAAAAPEDFERLLSDIEDRRKRLIDEYQSLKEEKARIGAGEGQSPGSSVADRMADWTEKMNDHARRRRIFNEAVEALNTTAGQNVKPLPPL